MGHTPRTTGTYGWDSGLRRLTHLALGTTLLLMLGACGGIVEYGPPDANEAASGGAPATGGNPASGGAEDPASGGSRQGGDDDRSGRGPAGGKDALGKCVEGFLRDENLTLPCNWLADGRCYDEKLEACACICPRKGDSTCLSGFYGGDGSATEVSCF